MSPFRILLSAALLTVVCASHAAEPVAAGSSNLQLRIERLRGGHAMAEPRERAALAEELGAALAEVREYEEAERLLREALAGAATKPEKARIGNLLGQVLATRGKRTEALQAFTEARADAQGDAALEVGTTINLARLSPPADRLGLLRAADQRSAQVADARERGRMLAAIGVQAAAIGGEARQLASAALAEAGRLARQVRDHRGEAEAADALSQLLADTGRPAEALRLVDAGVVAAGRIDARDLLMNLEWRRGRLLRAGGDAAGAIAAYQRAVDALESIRQDIPVTYEGGSSSFRETLSPIYLGLADLLLAPLGGADEQSRLRRARDIVELVKQSELQDFLGDRCSVDSARRTSSQTVPAGIAIYYPVILPDRLELLVETGSGLFRVRSPVLADRLRGEALKLGSQLRNREEYLPRARQLYDWLIRPVADELARQKINTLVTVPDGALRLVPFAALHDGRAHLIETMAIATAPGMTLTADSRAPDAQNFSALLAGLAEPGSVVDKLPASFAAGPPGETVVETTRGIRTRSVNRSAAPAAGDNTRASRTAALREMYALPGVRDEIKDLGAQMSNVTLVDAAFTLGNLSRNVVDGQHRIVHLASHGFFGGTAEESFIMTYDEILSIGRLQDLLQSDAIKGKPIELLTLSACQTAEGDDRSPLGISGAALKAKAKSALGTLWPVSDDAARDLMPKFYRNLVQQGDSKALSLRRAQVEILRDERFAHPFFWAPFILVGNWQ